MDVHAHRAVRGEYDTGDGRNDGRYRNLRAPTEDKDVQGVFDIETVTGHTIRIYNGVLTCNFANGINFSNVLGIECELEIQEAGEKPPYKVFPPGQVPPTGEITSQS